MCPLESKIQLMAFEENYSKNEMILQANEANA